MLLYGAPPWLRRLPLARYPPLAVKAKIGRVLGPREDAPAVLDRLHGRDVADRLRSHRAGIGTEDDEVCADRKSAVQGKGGSVSDAHGDRRILKKKKKYET